jgi:hypothetical protein
MEDMRVGSLFAEAVLTEWLDVGLDALTGSFINDLTGPSLQAGEWSPPKGWRVTCTHCCLIKGVRGISTEYRITYEEWREKERIHSLSARLLGIISRGQGLVRADGLNILNPGIKLAISLAFTHCSSTALEICASDRLEEAASSKMSLAETTFEPLTVFWARLRLLTPLGLVAMDRDWARPVLKKKADAVTLLDGPHDLYHLGSSASPPHFCWSSIEARPSANQAVGYDYDHMSAYRSDTLCI